MVWANNNYLYKRPITLLSSQVSGGSNLSSFPALISTTVADLAVTGSGGKVTNSNGYDIIFYDPTETTQLAHEIESYTSTTGAIVFWVNIPTLNAAGNTVIYMYYGWPSVPNVFQSTPTAVWDANYVGVWHLKEATGTTLSNSTSVASLNATKASATHPAAATGNFGGSQQFNNTTSSSPATDYATVPDTAVLDFGANQDFTVSCWVNSTQAAGSQSWPSVVSKEDGVATQQGYGIVLHDGSTAAWYFYIVTAGTTALLHGSGNVADGTWHYLVGKRGGASHNTIFASQDGSASLSLAASNASVSKAIPLEFGVESNNRTIAAGWGLDYVGNLDEVRVSNIARTDAWIATEYNNQKTPSSFFTVGNATIRGLDLASRFKLSVVVITGHDLSSRLKLSATKNVDLQTRLRLASVAGLHDSRTRLRLSSVAKLIDLSSRFSLSLLRQRDTSSRFTLLSIIQRNQAQRFRLASPPKLSDIRQRFNILAPLSLYGTNAATSTLSTANGFDTVTGGTATSTSSSLASGTTGYGEIYSQGSSPAWASGNGAGALGSPSGHGWLWDVTTLVGQMIVAGNWQQKVTLGTSVTFTTSLFGRWYKYNAGTYTPIGSSSLTAQTLTAPSTTALTLLGTNTASSTLSTADTLVTASGASAQTAQTQVGTSSGYGQLYSQGNAGAWPALGALGSPDGHGWLWDVTTLEGATIPAGNWSAVQEISSAVSGSTGNFTATIFVRAFKRSSGGAYTAIGTLTLASQAFTSSITTYTLPATAFSSVSFGVGDKLYWDIWLNITTPDTAAGNNINLYRGFSSTQGASNAATLVTPGYQTGGATLFTLPTQALAATAFNTGDKLYMDVWGNITGAPASAATLSSYVSSSSSLGVAGDAELDAPGYITQPANVRTQDILGRLRLASAAKAVDTSTRVRLASAAKQVDASTRVRLASAAKRVDTPQRVRLAATKQSDILVRLKLAPFRQVDTSTRVRISIQKSADLLTFYRLAATKNVDLAERFKLASVAGLHDSQMRYRFAATRLADTSQRFRVQVFRTLDLSQRFLLQGTKQNDVGQRVRLASAAMLRDIHSRYVLSAAKNVDTQTRFKIAGNVQNKDATARLRFAATKNTDTPLRFKLASVAGLHDSQTRYRVAATKQADTQQRLRVAATLTKDSPSRLRLSSTAQLRDTQARVRISILKSADLGQRLRLASASQQRDLGTRYRLAIAKQNDIGQRLRLASAAKTADILLLYRLSVTRLMDVHGRYVLSSSRSRDAVLRLKLASVNQLRDSASRLKLSSPNQLRDTQGRYKLASVNQLRDSASRFKQNAQVTKDITSRYRLRATKISDVSLRFIVQTVNARIRDIQGRYNLLASQRRDAQLRFRLAILRDLSSRLKVLATTRRDSDVRLRLASSPQLRDSSDRFRLASASQQKDTGARYKLAILRQLNTSQRIRLASAPKLIDWEYRLKLASAVQLHDTPVRYRLAFGRILDARYRFVLVATPLRDLQWRFLLFNVILRRQDYPVRFPLGIGVSRNVAARFVSRAPTLRDAMCRYRLVSASHTRDTSCRFNLKLVDTNIIMAVRSGDITMHVRSGNILMTMREEV